MPALEWPGLLVILLKLVYAAALVAVAVFDIRERRVPNRITYPSILLALITMFITPGWASALVGGVAGGMFMLVPVIAFGRQGGMGDVKLALLIGLVIGWPAMLSAVMVAFIVAALFSLVGILTGRLGRRSTIPFAPFLAVGGLAGLFGVLPSVVP